MKNNIILGTTFILLLILLTVVSLFMTNARIEALDAEYSAELTQAKFSILEGCTSNPVNVTCNATCNPVTKTYTHEIRVWEEDPFQLVSESLAKEHTYKLNVFDCTEFSEELARRYRLMGYVSAKTVIVTVDCDSGFFEETSCEETNGLHMIVNIGGKRGIYIEATTGKVIVPEHYGVYGI